MNLKKYPALCAGLAISYAVLGLASSTAFGQAAPASSAATTDTTPPPPAPTDKTVALSPFTVTTDKDRGYAATNEISGSRVNTPIKDIPIPIQVITSQFIDDIGATNLRQSLSYSSGIMLQTQNDLENSGGTYGSPYGPGGVNNPQGLTSNINQVQIKIRGFVTNNVLRDGFLRENSTDSVNIDRIEVVEGPSALLYGIGNFGGVVDYLTKTPMDVQQGILTVSAGTYSFERGALDVTGPISSAAHLDYRLDLAAESSDTNVQYQKSSHVFIAPTVSWKPFDGTVILVDTEYGKSKQNGYGFQALRAVEGNSATPVDNDQIEAVSFYYPPGANKRDFNLSGPDTFVDQQESNIELKATQQITKEGDWVPELNALIGYNRSSVATQTQNVDGEITGPILAGNPGYNLATTIYTTGADNSIGGQGSNNGNLVFGPLPAAVTEYQWNQGTNKAVRDQERVELTGHKLLFADKWYQFDDTFLAGYSAIRNDITSSTRETNPALYSYKNPTDLSPIHFGVQGDGTADPAMFTNHFGTENLGWDSAYYLNNYAKLFKVLDRQIILMDGVRRDKMDNFSTDNNVATPGAAPTATSSRGLTSIVKSYQNGVMVELTPHLSIYGLQSNGVNPNFGGLHDAVTGNPVSADRARSREYGIKFDFLDGKISGTIAHYKITKTAWVAEPWYAPAPMGNPRFNPNKDIVYELSGGFEAANNTFPGNASQGAPVQNQPQVEAAWTAAVNAGAIYTIPGAPTGRLYLDASKPTGAAYLDAAFAANQASGGAWPGWLYQGDSNQDPNINNATMDAAGFYNTALSPAFQIVDQSKGWDGEITFTPNNYLQIVVNGSIKASVSRLNLGTYPKYPYPQDRWAVWYFQNGGFGLDGQPLNVAYTNPADTSTRTNAGVYPGDDTPKYAADGFINYKFLDSLGGRLNGFSVGFGAQWHAQEEYFSGVTHGGQNIEQNAAGQTIVAYSPSKITLNAMAKFEWKKWGHAQFVQANIDNLTDDVKLYGLIYSSPLQAKVSYGIGF